MKTMTPPVFMHRWRGVAVAAIYVLGGVVLARADDPIPKAFPADRYAAMAARSPFTPPTVQAAPVAAPTPPPGPSWGDKLTVTDLVEDTGGTYKVTVVDPEQTQHIYLQSDEEHPILHMQVASVKWPKVRDDQPGVREAPVITIRKGTEFATVRYEPAGGGAGGVPGGMPGAQGINRAFLPPNPAARPAGAPAIPGSNGMGLAVPPLPTSAGVAPATAGSRRAPIRSAPPTPPPTAIRPIAPPNPGVQVARPGVINNDDDDDDDD